MGDEVSLKATTNRAYAQCLKTCAGQLREYCGEISAAAKACEYCRHGESIGIQSGLPVVCMIHEKTVHAAHTCERWEIILPNAETLATRGLEQTPENHAGDGQPSGLPPMTGYASEISDNTMNRYQYHSGDLSEDPWISFPNNGGDVGDVFELAEELNKLRDALIRLNSAVIARMIPDEPTGSERLELLRASEHAREIIGQNV